MKEIPVTAEMLEWARQEQEDYDGGHVDRIKTYQDVATQGALAEAAFQKEHPEARRTNSASHDFTLAGKKYEVKSQHTKTPPHPNFKFALPRRVAQQTSPEAVYAFYSVPQGNRVVYSLGQITHKDFMEKSTLRLKGELGVNGAFRYKYDNYEIKFGELKSQECDHEPLFYGENDNQYSVALNYSSTKAIDPKIFVTKCRHCGKNLVPTAWESCDDSE